MAIQDLFLRENHLPGTTVLGGMLIGESRGRWRKEAGARLEKGVLLFLRKVSTQLILLASLGYCSSVDTSQTEGWAFETIARGESSGIIEERHGAIQDQAEWNEFWKSHAGADSPVPIVDFQNEMIIVVHLGTRNTAGYAVNVTGIENRMGELAIYYDETKPGPQCIVAQVVTHPYHFVKVQRTENERLFIKHEQIRAC